MKRLYIILIMLSGILGCMVHSQNTGQNYLKTRTHIDHSGNVQEQTVYCDGLGRPIETVNRKATPGSKDLVTLQEYDTHGRESRTWLPAMTGGDTGAFVAAATVKSGAVALNKGDGAPYTDLLYEASPLGRVEYRYGPGTDWAEKPVHNSYTGNTISNAQSYSGPTSIIAFVPTSGNGVQKKGYADFGNFFVTRTTDEDGNEVCEFKDRHGRLAMTRSLEGDTPYSTYYVYDDAGNLRYVLPPVLADRFEGNVAPFLGDSDTQMQLHAYIYRYDGFNRCIYKKLPGCEPVYYIYDKAGRIVFSQDGELREAGKWMFHIPDVMGRTVLTGICTNTLDYADKPMEDTVVKATWGAGTTTNMGYTISGVTLASPVILTAGYYDSYGFVGKNGVPATGLDYTAATGFGTRYGDFKGLLTGQAIRQLDAAGTAGYIYAAFHYDDRGRVIQTHSTNHLGGIDSEYMAYNLVGDVLQRKTTHTAGNAATQTGLYTYTYDHDRRLTGVRYKRGNDAEFVMLENTYNDLGQLVSTQRHGSSALKTGYEYNVRSWLTAISGSKFSQNLYYNTGNGTPCYNGNISSMTWKAGNETTLRGYKFTYDGLNRMLDAIYGEGTSLNSNANRFTEKVTGYDKNGNILALQRYGQTGTSTYGLIDNLTFTLDGNQLNRVDDASTATAYNNGFEFKDAVKQTNEYAYDANGNLTKDLNKNISNIQYNCLNLPRKVTFTDGSTIEYTYAADGTKLRTKHVINGTTTTTDYCGNVIYENGVQKLLLTEAGYLTLADSKYHYYLQDHQGNNRVVIDQNGTVEETNHYYPFGGVFASASSVQPYKYNGKELDTKKGLNWYDYGARHYDAAVGRFHTQDRFAEKYYPMSPYQYGANNPVNCIDVNGDSIIINKENINAFISAIYNGVENANFVMKFNNGVLDPNSFKQQAINSSDFFLKDLYEIATNDKMVEISFSDKNTYQINGKKISEPFGIPYDDNDKDLLYQKESLLKANIPIGNHVQGNLGQTLVPDIALPSGKKSMTSNVQVIINSNGNVKHRTIGLAHEFGHVILYLNNKPFGHTQLGVDNFVYSRATLMSKRLGYDY